MPKRQQETGADTTMVSHGFILRCLLSGGRPTAEEEEEEVPGAMWCSGLSLQGPHLQGPGHDDDCEGERGFLVTGMTCQNALRGSLRAGETFTTVVETLTFRFVQG